MWVCVALIITAAAGDAGGPLDLPASLVDQVARGADQVEGHERRLARPARGRWPWRRGRRGPPRAPAAVIAGHRRAGGGVMTTAAAPARRSSAWREGGQEQDEDRDAVTRGLRVAGGRAQRGPGLQRRGRASLRSAASHPDSGTPRSGISSSAAITRTREIDHSICMHVVHICTCGVRISRTLPRLGLHWLGHLVRLGPICVSNAHLCCCMMVQADLKCIRHSR